MHPNLSGFSQFGFGRRTCQGVPIVEMDLFLAMGGMAWAFRIQKKRKADGTEVPVHWNDFTPLLIAKPSPFEFDMIPRNGEATAHILRGMWETGKGEDDEEIERAAEFDRKITEDRHREAIQRAAAAAAAARKEQESAAEDDDVCSVGGSDTSGGSLLAPGVTPKTASSLSSTSSVSDFPQLRADADIW